MCNTQVICVCVFGQHELLIETDAATNQPVCRRLVLEFDDEEKKNAVVEVNKKLVQKLKPHQAEGKVMAQAHTQCRSFMNRVTHGLAATYLTDLCEQCSNTRLRSASRGNYILPRSRLCCVDSSFSISAPTAWNNLPAHIRSCTSLSQFLSKLKSHLFITSFPPQ